MVGLGRQIFSPDTQPLPPPSSSIFSFQNHPQSQQRRQHHKHTTGVLNWSPSHLELINAPSTKQMSLPSALWRPVYCMFANVSWCKGKKWYFLLIYHAARGDLGRAGCGELDGCFVIYFCESIRLASNTMNYIQIRWSARAHSQGRQIMNRSTAGCKLMQSW